MDKIYNVMKIASLVITGVFVVIFYSNYKKINVESNLKKFIIHIIKFKKTANLFIFSNILLLFLFIGSFTAFIIFTIKKQNIQIDNPTFWINNRCDIQSFGVYCSHLALLQNCLRNYIEATF